MEYIYDFAKSVIFFTVFENIWEIIVPRGKFASYIKLLFGFMLIGIILSPLTKLTKKDIYGAFSYNMRTAESELKFYGEKYYGYIEKEFSERVAAELRANGFESVKGCKGRIERSGSGVPFVSSLEITVNGETEGIKEKIAEYLGFDVNKIEIRGAYENT